MNPVFTIGHSTRPADEFRQLLQAHDVRLLVDVRHFPTSRRFPHFSGENLKNWLAGAGIGYLHEIDLGGRRRPQPESVNLFWQNSSFRAYADYMASPEFNAALARLIALSQAQYTAIMCAEAVPWRCHRWLISDALTARGLEVIHIVNPQNSQPHALNPNARLDAQGHLTYPALWAEAVPSPPTG